MYNHEPNQYDCPFCLAVKGIESDFPYTKQADIFYHDHQVTALVASHWWPNNEGFIIIVPNRHFENLFDIPSELLADIHQLSKPLAKALMETYNCEGVSTRQHNGPDGGQDVWHYHLQVLPRYHNDQLYLLEEKRYLSDPIKRANYASKLRNWCEQNRSVLASR